MTAEELNRLYASLRDFRIQHTETDSGESRAVLDAMNIIAAVTCGGDGKRKPHAKRERAMRIAALDMAVTLYAHGPQGDGVHKNMTELVMDAAPVFAGWIRDGVE